GGARSRAAESELHRNRCTSRWRSDTQASGAGTNRAAGTRTLGGRTTAQRLGHCKFQGNTTKKDEAGTEGRCPRGHLRQDFSWARGFDRRSYGSSAQPAAAGECNGQLREDRAANSREDRFGSDCTGESDPPAWNERGRDGDNRLRERHEFNHTETSDEGSRTEAEIVANFTSEAAKKRRLETPTGE